MQLVLRHLVRQKDGGIYKQPVPLRILKMPCRSGSLYGFYSIYKKIDRIAVGSAVTGVWISVIPRCLHREG